MEYCTILCTTSNKEEAEKIAESLIEKELIACCNIISAVTSIYKWEGKINKDNEFLMIMKSQNKLYGKIEQEIKKIHSYKIPEIICIPLIAGSKDYLNWISEQIEV